MTDELRRLSAALADRYRVERELGRGGMATVYLAEDLRHRRQVAVKVLKPEYSAAVGSERFLREIEIAAGLLHPHILTLIDSGDADGLLYYVMPYVQGESLSDRVGRQGPLPLADVGRITRETADAIAHAHASGIVHRDIKPANILLAHDHAFVTDFGIARALSGSSREPLTGTGLAVGTPGYSSPEQVSGDAVDVRTDVYGLACVVYEMLTGEAAFSAPTSQGMLARQFSRDLEPIATRRPEVPPAVDEVLEVALAPDPEQRYASLTAFAEAFEGALATAVTSRRGRWIRGGLAIVALLGVIGVSYFVVRSAEPADRSVAVLPFGGVGDEESRYWAAGATEGIEARLAEFGVDRVVVPAAYAPSLANADSARAILRTVGAGYLLQGSVTKREDSLRVVVRLLEQDGATVRWERVYETGLGEAFTVQDDIADRVAVLVGARTEQTRSEASARPVPGSIEAYEHYTRGRVYWSERTVEGNAKAVAAFTAALESDSTYARAYAGLADAHLVAATYGWEVPAEEYAMAQVYARRAMVLDPNLPEAHATLGSILADYLWDWPAAEAELRRAVELDPRYATAHSWLALGYTARERGTEAWVEAQQSLAMDPLSPVITANAVAAALLTGHVAEAVAIGGRGRRLSPANLPLLFYLGLAHVERGETRTALAIAADLARIAPTHPASPVIAARAHWRAGDGARARAALAKLRRLPAQPERSYALASVHALLGDTTEAFAWLNRAVNERAYNLLWLRVDPNWVDLHNDPRFRAALILRGIETP